MKACPAPERLCRSQRGIVTPAMETEPLGGVLPFEQRVADTGSSWASLLILGVTL